jgi:purine-binding chemotaxis protein CheW
MGEERDDRDAIWSETRHRLTELAETVRRGRAPDRETVRRILEERARLLAQPPSPPPPTDLLEVVVFVIARENYAIAAASVAGVFRLTGRSALPGAPEPIAGVTAHRGELLTLIDLRADLGLQPKALDDLGRVVVVRGENGRAGILVDRVEELRTVRTSELTPPAERASARPGPILGVTPDVVAVLDPDAILRFLDGGDDT